jgi:equilibrative nucleoside transporter 1/2/3
LFLSIQFGKYLPVYVRIIGGFLIFFFGMVTVPLVHYLPDWWLHCSSGGCFDIIKLSIVLFAVFWVGVSSGVTFGAIVAFASYFPPQYIGATMSGMGVAGVLAGLLGIVIKLTSPDSLQRNAFIYFSVGAALMIVSIASFLALYILPYSKFMTNPIVEFIMPESESSDREGEVDTVPDESTPLVPPSARVHYGRLLLKIGPDVFSAFFVFFVTLFLFPGLTLEIEPSWSGLSASWLGILLIFTFQLFDFIGRTLPRFVIFIPRRLVIFLALFRVVFIFLFIILVRPHWLTSNAWAFAFMVVFAVSNGYLGTLAMMYGPQGLAAHEKEAASVILSFALNAGVFAGVNTALLLLLLVH